MWQGYGITFVTHSPIHTTMTEKAHEALKFWLGQHPESTHPLDTKRLHMFVKQLLDDDDYNYEYILQDEARKAHPEWPEEFVKEFVNKKTILISELMQFGEFLRGE